MNTNFPKDFLWGVASSAGQVEGAAFECGRSASIWDVYARIPGVVHDGSTPDVSCDEYNRLEEHIAYMKKLGINSYRFSFSWSRILPDGENVNTEGIAYYQKLISLLQANHITPVATIYHWDLPYCLQIKGGFGNRDCIKWYLHYAKVLFEQFGNQVGYWATFNEPIAVYVGYALGFFAPGLKDEQYARQALHNLLVCHGEAVKLFRRFNFSKSKIGIVVDVWHHYPLRKDNLNDQALAEFNNETAGYGMFLNPVFLGKYPELLLQYLTAKKIKLDIVDGDMETISQPIDFYGLNFYNAIFDRADERVKLDGSNGGNFQQSDASVAGKYFYDALYDVLCLLRDKYHLNVPVIITENGYCATDEAVSDDGTVHDEYRIKYIREILKQVSRAVNDGFNIKGYHCWSLFDNWEWSAGYTMKYGLISVDFDTQKYTPKQSFNYYLNVIRTNGEEL